MRQAFSCALDCVWCCFFLSGWVLQLVFGVETVNQGPAGRWKQRCTSVAMRVRTCSWLSNSQTSGQNRISANGREVSGLVEISEASHRERCSASYCKCFL